MTRSKADGEAATSSGVPDLSQLVTSKKYECVYDGCKRSYTSMGNLKTHLKAHQGKYDYRCDHDSCEKAFLSSYSLKVHRRTHTGEKPYSCESDGCVKSFNTLYRLNAHKRVHTGQLFECEYYTCPKQFTTRSDMKKHTRTHSTEKPYPCKMDGCGKSFKAPHHLRTHSLKHQPRDATTGLSAMEAGGEERGEEDSPQSSTTTSSESSSIGAMPSESYAYSPATSQLLESLSQESTNWLASLLPTSGQALSGPISPLSVSSSAPSSVGTTSQNNASSSSSVPPVPQSVVSQGENLLAPSSTVPPLQPVSTSVPEALPQPPPPLQANNLRLTSEITSALQALQVLSSSGALQSLLNLSQLQSSVPPPNPLPNPPPPPSLHHPTAPVVNSLPVSYPSDFSLPLMSPITQLVEDLSRPAVSHDAGTGSHDTGIGSHDYVSGSHDYQQHSQSMPAFPQPTHTLYNSSQVQQSINFSGDSSFQPPLMHGYEDYLDHGTQTLPIDLDALLLSPYPAQTPPTTHMSVSSSHGNITGNSPRHHHHHHLGPHHSLGGMPPHTTILPNFISSPSPPVPTPPSAAKVDQASQTDASVSCSTSCCSSASVKSESCGCCGCCSCECGPCSNKSKE